MNIRNMSNVFQKNKPFPHIVLDNYFKKELLEEVLLNWPKKGWRQYGRGKSAHTGKVVKNFPIIQMLNSKEFISDLEVLTGISEILPDHSLFGGGLHNNVPGAYLRVHVDFNQLKTEIEENTLYRRLNLLIYLNKKWKDSWNGHLELWGGEKNPEKLYHIIKPKFNRMVIFETSEHSWHGHPKVLKCPKNESRKSIAMYYYTKEFPPWAVKSHSTIYRDV